MRQIILENPRWFTLIAAVVVLVVLEKIYEAFKG